MVWLNSLFKTISVTTEYSVEWEEAGEEMSQDQQSREEMAMAWTKMAAMEVED